MALQMTFIFSGVQSISGQDWVAPQIATSVTVVDSYIKVESVDACKDNATALVSVSKNGHQYRVAKYEFTPDLEGENFIKQAYLHLKTLPEFADAEDC